MNGFIEHVKYKEELNKAVLFQNYFTFSTLKLNHKQTAFVWAFLKPNTTMLKEYM